jgi:hypothetical protein
LSSSGTSYGASGGSGIVILYWTEGY